MGRLLAIQSTINVKLDLGADDAEMDSRQDVDFWPAVGSTIDMTFMNDATRTGYALDGWYTENGLPWDENEAVNFDVCDEGDPAYDEDYHNYVYTLTLTARWSLSTKAEVHYDLGTGAGDILDPSIYLINGEIKVSEISPTPPANKVFIGWQDRKGNIHLPGDTFVFDTNELVVTINGKNMIPLTALYASQGVPEASITYVANYPSGATGTGEESVEKGPYAFNEKVTLEGDTAFTCNGYTLDGWSDTAAGEKTYDLNANVVVDNVTKGDKDNILYGHWSAHVHEWTYAPTTDGKGITATCDVPGHSEAVGSPSVTLVAPNNTAYTGNPVSATLENLDEFNSKTGVNISAADIVYYSGEDELDSAPTDVGTYTARLTVEGATAEAPFAITKADSSVATAPAGKTGLTYNGTDQPLVGAGEASGGTMKYRLGDDGEWTDTPPAATDAGTYDVYYYVKGDNNHNDTAVAGPVSVTIAKKPITATATDKSSAYKAALETLSYTVPEGSLAEGDDADSIKIDLVTEAVNTAEAGSTFPITGTVKADSNPNYNVTVTSGTYTITKAEAIVTVTGFEGEYDGAAHGLTVKVEDPRTNPFTDLLEAVFGTDDENEAVVYYSNTTALTAENYATAGQTDSITYTEMTNGAKTIYYYVDLTNYTAKGTPDGVSGYKAVNILQQKKTESELSNDQKPSGPNDANTLTYNGAEQNLVIPPAQAPDGYLVYYSTDEGESWHQEVPTGKDAGTYTVMVRYLGDLNHETFDGADIVVTIEPKEVRLEWADLELTYSGDPQQPTATATELCGNDTCTVTVEGAQTNAGDDYTATAAGLSNSNYKLPENVTTNFKIVAKTADKEELTEAQSAKANGGLIYSGEPQDLVIAPTEYPEGYSGVQYSLDGETWGELNKLPTGTDAGNYTVHVKYVPANGNYAEFEAYPINVSISPKTLTVAWNEDPEYTGSAIVYGADVTGIVAADAEGVTITYAGNIETDVGAYHARIAIGGERSSNYQIAADDKTHDWNIKKASATAYAPTAKSDLTYNAKSQGLINAGNTYAQQGDMLHTTGTMKYFLSATELVEAPATTASGWTDNAENIAAIDAGTYYVYYYVAGDENHSDTAVLGPVAVSIAPKDISEGADGIEAEAADSTYTGSPLTPAVTVTFDNGIFSPEITLEKGTDYTVTVPAGAGTNAAQGIQLTVTGTGNYTGSRTVSWNINKAEVEEPDEESLPEGLTTLTYNRSAQGLVAEDSGVNPDNGTFLYKVLTKDGEEVPGAQWSATKPSATDAGEYVIVYYVKGDANHNDYGSEAKPMGTFTATISPKTLTADDVTFDTDTFVYEKDKEQGPAITVKDGAAELAENTDFTLAGTKQENVGTYTAVVTGTGNYTSTVNIPYEITKASSAMEAFDENQRPTPNKPSADTNLVYNKTAQDLVNPPAEALQGYTGVQYSLDGQTWGELNEIPTGTDAGTYRVYYRFVGDDNHSDVTCDAPLVVIIDPKPVTIKAKDQVISHDGSIEQGVDQVNVDGLVENADLGHALAEITLEQTVTADLDSNEGKIGTIIVKEAKITDGTGADVTANYAITYNNEGKLTIKAAQDAPSDEDLKDLVGEQTTTSITINTQPGYEYILSTSPEAPAGDADWSTLAGDEIKGHYKEEGDEEGTYTFTDLDKGTVYYVHVRKAETDPEGDDPGKDPSPSVTVPTSTRPDAPATAEDGYDIGYTDEVLTAKDGYEIFDPNGGDDGEGAWVKEVKPFTPGGEYEVRVAGADGVAPSEAVRFTAPDRPDAPDAVDKGDVSSTDTTVTIDPTVGGQEYILVPKDATPEEIAEAWKNPTPSENGEPITFSGLKPDTEYVVITRVAAVEPSVDPEVPGKIHSYDSDPLPVMTAKSAPDTPEQDKLVGAAGNDGSIKGVDDTMEYSIDGGKTWVSVPDGETEITGLKPGDVLVRYEAVPGEGDRPDQPESAATTVKVEGKDADGQSPIDANDIETSTDTTSITVDKPVKSDEDATVYEYRIDGGEWQTANSFDGLEPGTTHTIEVRKAETDKAMASEPTAVTVTTTPEPLGEDDIEKTPTTITIKDPQPNTEYQLTEKDEDGNEVVVATVTVDKDGNITVEPEGKAEKNEDGDIVIGGLDPEKEYEITVAKTDDDGNVISDKSEPTTVETPALIPEDTPNTPSVEVKSDGTAVISPADNGSKYIVKDEDGNETTITVDEDGNVGVEPEEGSITAKIEDGKLVIDGLEPDTDYEITEVKTSTSPDNKDSEPSAPAKITTPKNAPESPEADKKATAGEKDGSIKNVDDTMEYSTDGGQTWIPVPAGATEITGLGAGEVLVRYAAVPGKDGAQDQPASEAKSVTVESKADQEAPTSAPSVKATSPTTIVVDPALPDEEYSIDGGKTWVRAKEGETTVVFDNLKPGTDYEVISRKVGTDQANPSPASPAAKVSTPRAEPSGLLLAKMTPKGSRALAITWSKVENVDGYDIFMAKCNHYGKEYKYKKVKTINGNEKFSFTKKLLKKNTAYKVYVKAFVKENGKKKYVSTSLHMHCYTGNGAAASNVKAIKVAKNKFSLKVGKTKKVKATIVKVNKNKPLMSELHAAPLRYLSSNTKVATVTKAGVVKAKAKGKCYIYAVGVNGARAKVKVTVK